MRAWTDAGRFVQLESTLAEAKFRAMRNWTLFTVALLAMLAGPLAAAPPAEADRERQFAETVTPFLQSYCQSCHGKSKQEAKLDLSAFTSAASVAQRHQTWALVLERLEAGEMPPEEAKHRPTAEERKATIAWIRDFRKFEAERGPAIPASCSPAG